MINWGSIEKLLIAYPFLVNTLMGFLKYMVVFGGVSYRSVSAHAFYRKFIRLATCSFAEARNPNIGRSLGFSKTNAFITYKEYPIGQEVL